MQMTWDDGGCLAGVDCLPFRWPMAVAVPQASGRNGRLRLCGVVWAMGPLEAAIQYTALLVFVWLFVFVGMPFISVDRSDITVRRVDWAKKQQNWAKHSKLFTYCLSYSVIALI